jgi:hypothetical protein
MSWDDLYPANMSGACTTLQVPEARVQDENTLV